MIFNCSSCGQALEIDDAVASGTAQCPFCQAIVAVPPRALPARTNSRFPMLWIVLSLCIVVVAATGGFFLWWHYNGPIAAIRTKTAKSAEFRKSIVGQWTRVDGSGPWLEFTKDGKFIIWQKPDSKAITLKDSQDLSFEFVSGAEVRVEDFLFVVDVGPSELKLTGKGGVNILLSDGSFFPPTAGQSAKFIRKK